MHLIFDANLSHRLAEGLTIFESGDKKSIITKIEHADRVPSLGLGALDPDVIRYAGPLGAIIISQDDDFKRVKHNLELIIQLKAAYVLYRPPKHGSRYWEIVESFVSGWQEMKKILSQDTPPFIYQIDKKGKMQKVVL